MSQLLLDHGFLDEPVEAVVTATFAIDDDDQLLDEKLDVLENSGAPREPRHAVPRVRCLARALPRAMAHAESLPRTISSLDLDRAASSLQG